MIKYSWLWLQLIQKINYRYNYLIIHKSFHQHRYLFCNNPSKNCKSTEFTDISQDVIVKL